MRIAICLCVLVGAVGTARADESADQPAGAKSENGALALAIGGEVAALGLMAAPLIHDMTSDGCANGDAVGNPEGLPQCGSLEHSVLPGMVITGAVGTLVAPSLGHWYAGEVWTRGMTLRLGGAGVAAAGALLMANACLAEGCSGSEEAPGAVVAVVGGLAYLAGTVDDLATTRKAVRAHNARLRDLAVVPAPTPHGGGVVLSGRF